MFLTSLLLSGPANAAPAERPRTRVAISSAIWGYRQGPGARLELTRAFSLTTALDLFNFRVGLVSHTGLEMHPVSLSLGSGGWLEPVLGVGAFATGGVAPLHRDPVTGSGVYAAPGVRWYGPRARSATLLGVTGRHLLNGNPALDQIALTVGFEVQLGKRKTRSERAAEK